MNLKNNLAKKIIKENVLNPKRAINTLSSLSLPKFAKNFSMPISVDIEPTVACNLQCPMCHRAELAKKRKKLTMTFETFKKIIDRLPSVLKMNLQGMGEPLVARDFFKMVKYAKNKGIVVTTVTNGNLMNEKKVSEILGSGLDRMYVSIDSLKREQYVKYRPGGNLDIVKKNLAHLMDMRKKSDSGLRVGIWMLLFNDNFDQLIPMINYAKSIGVDELIINPEITDRGKTEWKEIISAMKISRKKISNKAITKAIIEAREAGVNVSIAKGMGVMKPTPEAICEWPWKSLYVDTEGNISPCCIIADAKVMGMGNILKCDFETIWNSQKYRQFRKQHLSGKIPDACKACYKKN